jgi:hypothetical protein
MTVSAPLAASMPRMDEILSDAACRAIFARSVPDDRRRIDVS